MKEQSLNHFQKWATDQLTQAGHKVAYVANWIRVNDELDLMSYSGVDGYIKARQPVA